MVHYVGNLEVSKMTIGLEAIIFTAILSGLVGFMIGIFAARMCY